MSSSSSGITADTRVVASQKQRWSPTDNNFAWYQRCDVWGAQKRHNDVFWKKIVWRRSLTLKLWAEFLTLVSVDYVWTYLKRTQLLCVICHCLWATCPCMPCLSWSAVAMHALTWVVFVSRPSFTATLRSGSALVTFFDCKVLFFLWTRY